MKIRNTAKNMLGLLSLPAGTYLFFFLVCRLNGSQSFGVGADLNTIIVNTIYTGLISLAVSYNLTSGRFDFSVGSVLVLSNIIGFQFAVNLGLGPLPTAFVTIAVGAVLGFVSGMIYVILQLPPMVCSLGVAMIFEAVGFIITKGAGVRLIGRNDLLVFASGPAIYILIGIILAVLVVLLNFTVFGCNCNSLRTGQEISVNVGINEKKNSVQCYMVAGALMAAAGLINTSRLGTVSVETGLASSSYIMNAFLPMFIGGALAKFADRNIGILAGSFAQACMISAFGTGKLNFSSNLQTVLSGLAVLIFMYVSNNSYQLEEARILKMRRQAALEEQKAKT